MKSDKEKKTKKVKDKAKRRKILLRIIIGFVVFFLISNAIATKIIYDVIFARYDGEPDFDVSEYDDVSSVALAVSIPEDDEILQGYFYDSDDEKGLLVIAPGLHAGAEDYLPLTEYFLNEGWDVLAFDPLGSCGSSGKSEIGFSQETEDLRAVLDFADTQYAGEDLYLLGHSRGGFAVCAVLEDGYDIKAAVSISGINSAMEAIIGLSEKYVGKIANANYFNLWAYQVMLFGTGEMALEADDIISESDVPVLIIQGADDTTASPDEFSTYSHMNEITSEDAEFILRTSPDNSGHTDIMFDEDGVDDELMEEIELFLEQAE